MFAASPRLRAGQLVHAEHRLPSRFLPSPVLPLCPNASPLSQHPAAFGKLSVLIRFLLSKQYPSTVHPGALADIQPLDPPRGYKVGRTALST